MPDQETVNGQFGLLRTLRGRLAIHLQQRDTFKEYAPAYIHGEIVDARNQIARIKNWLNRNNIDVDSEMIDEETDSTYIAMYRKMQEY